MVAIEVGAGDLIRVPLGTHHWFDLCSDRCIRAIRLFQDPAGWTPHYTGSGVDRGYEPVCFGPTYIPAPPGGQLAQAVLSGGNSIQAILLDIEGTTTPVDFVFRTLFPFARQRLGQFLLEHGNEPDIRRDVEALRTQQRADAAAELDPAPWRG